MPQKRKTWPIEKIAEYLETRVEPKAVAVSEDPACLEFDPVQLFDTAEAEAKLTKAGLRPEPDGGYWHKAIKQHFPPNQGRPPRAGLRYDPLPEEGGVEELLGTKAPPYWKVARLAALMVELGEPVPIPRLACIYDDHLAAVTNKRIIADPVRTNGFRPLVDAALTLLRYGPHPINLDPVKCRHVAEKWRRARSSGKSD